MNKFEVTILGCGAALPTTRHFSAAQVVNIREKLFLVDCGEGTQLQLRRSHLRFMRINHIFISHLHGDHCLGLLGFISTLGLLGRRADLHLYAHADLQRLVEPQLDYFCRTSPFRVVFHHIDPTRADLIYEDNSLTVHTIPLHHRVPCCGFLFSEKQGLRHIKRDMADFYHVPSYAMNRIKEGEDFITPEGERIPNERLTTPPDPARRYAYCSDTAYHEAMVEQLQGIDLLYHEATFAETDKAKASETCHSTARQAAHIARLAQVGRLVIGHFSARNDDERLLLQEASEVFTPCLLAEENLTITL